MSRSKQALVFVLALVAAMAGMILIAQISSPLIIAHTASPFHFVQQTVPIPPPEAIQVDLNRLSWGAVIAGSLIAIMIQLSFNLLGIAVGATSISPENDDPASPKSLATGAAVWVGLSTLISLFIGGWLAARFAGYPNEVDGLLHGVVVWAVVMLVSLFFLGTALGRVISGLTSLLGQGLGLMGRAAQGVAQVGGAVAQGVGNVAQSVGSAAVQGVSNVAQSVGSVAQNAAENVGDKVQDTMNSSPEVQDAMRRIDTARDTIMSEATRVLQQAGLSKERLQNEASNAAQDVKDAAQQVAQNPANADEAINTALDRLFSRAQNLGETVATETDRVELVRMLRERMNITEAQAVQLLDRWDQTYNQARQEFERVRREAGSRVQQVQRQAERAVNQAERAVNDAKEDVKQAARDVAQTTTDSIAKLAMAIFAAIIIGGIAAGIGGWFGAPDTATVVQTTSYSSTGSY